MACPASESPEMTARDAKPVPTAAMSRTLASLGTRLSDLLGTYSVERFALSSS